MSQRTGPWRVFAWRRCPRKGTPFQAWDKTRKQRCCSKPCGMKHWAASPRGRAYLTNQARKLLDGRRKKRWAWIFEQTQHLSPAQAFERGHSLGYQAGFEAARRAYQRSAA